jgi:hypothetical protein
MLEDEDCVDVGEWSRLAGNTSCYMALSAAGWRGRRNDYLAEERGSSTDSTDVFFVVF